MLRKKIFDRFENISDVALKIEEALVQQNALSLIPWHRLTNQTIVLAFLPLREEVSVFSLLERHLALGHRIAFPKIEGDCIRFVESLNGSFLNQEWMRGPLGIRVPEGANLDLLNIDQDLHGDSKLAGICYVPGLAFTLNGNRLGRGKGYYDRFLAQLPGFLRCSLAYSLQIESEDWKIDDWDQKIDILISP